MGKNRSKKKEMGLKHSSDVNGSGSWLDVDPTRVRYQHSRIRPYFSGCGRSVEGTLDSIRSGELHPTDLPPIQVIVGPKDDSGQWYFSLNNRRLWVLKRCREEGLLPNNRILVRVRQPKSNAEADRYSLAKCSVEARFIREKMSKSVSRDGSDLERGTEPRRGFRTTELLQSSDGSLRGSLFASDDIAVKEDDESIDSDDTSEVVAVSNRFSALL